MIGLYFKLHNVHRPVTMKRPPTPASTSGSEHGYFSSDDDVCSIEDLSSVSRKRKSDDSAVSNGKRRCGNNGRASPIEDHHYTSRRKPSLNSGISPQVHIHHNNNSSYNGRIMGTPTIPLTSVFSGQYNNDGSAPSVNLAAPNPQSSSSISALLNPTPNNSVGPQLAPITSGQTAPIETTSAQGMPIGLPIPMSTTTTMTAHHHPSQPIIPPMSNATPDPNLTHQVLQAHRQELQREVSHLSMLLNRTTAILVGLDQAMASNVANRGGVENTHSCMTYGSSPDNGSLLGNNRSHYSNIGLPTPPVNTISLGFIARSCAKQLTKKVNGRKILEARKKMEVENSSPIIPNRILEQGEYVNPGSTYPLSTPFITPPINPNRQRPVLNNSRFGARNNENNFRPVGIQDDLSVPGFPGSWENANGQIPNTLTSDQQYVTSLRFTYRTPLNAEPLFTQMRENIEAMPEAERSQRNRIPPVGVPQETRPRRMLPQTPKLSGSDSRLRPQLQQPQRLQPPPSSWQQQQQRALNSSQDQYNNQPLRSYTRRSRSQPQLHPLPLPPFGDYTEIPPVPVIPQANRQVVRQSTLDERSLPPIIGKNPRDLPLRQLISIQNMNEVSSATKSNDNTRVQSAQYESSISQYSNSDEEISSFRQSGASMLSDDDVFVKIIPRSKSTQDLRNANLSYIMDVNREGSTYIGMQPLLQPGSNNSRRTLNDPNYNRMIDNGYVNNTVAVNANNNYRNNGQLLYEQRTQKAINNSRRYY
ncbi:10383_t:CDS:2 [Acaulospora colombiana]|uniref:10383_t:CDS:1 n=1 Tax=Acaulospora colombiana TaxID=27376 RepID=A0ACA9KQI0_9GLOM|nr:10383_t:CDS:2 [Acaulospora colombiana]